MVVLKIIPQHLENDFTQGKVILVGLEGFVLVGKPVVQNLDVYAPDYVVKETRNAGGYALQNAHYF